MQINILEQRILKAEDGLFLTNGKTIVTVVVLGKEANITDWREITTEEKTKLEELINKEVYNSVLSE
jgi:hypothetical protein